MIVARRTATLVGLSLATVLAGDLVLVAVRAGDHHSLPPAAGAGARGAVVSALAARPEDFGRTARYSFRVSAVAQGSQRLLSGADGTADFRRGRANGQSLSVGDDNRTVATEFFVDGTSVYLRGDQRAWTKKQFDPNEVGSPVATEPVLGRSYDTREPVYARDRGLRREIFSALVARVDDRGTEAIHGVATRHFNASLDMARARASLAQPVLREMAAWGENEPPAEVDVWVDATRRLRRSSVVYDSPRLGFRVDTEWWDHDRAAQVEVPGRVARVPSFVGVAAVIAEVAKPPLTS